MISMTEGVSNNSNIETYKYNNPELSKYDSDGDGTLSVFEMNNISDESGIDILLNDLNIQTQKDIQGQDIDFLENKLSSVKEEQGLFSSAWNKLKCITGIGSSTKKCEQAIQDYKNGKISYEEADSIISGFSQKQKNSVNLVANIATGVAAVAVVGSAFLTGGLSLGVVAGAAAVGGATKAGIKFLDRATNKKTGDALDAKQITKDVLTGAVDGAVSVATMGIGATTVTAKTVAEQTLKETIKKGAIAGAEAGAISGAVTGASDYTIEAALEEDVQFNIGDLASATITTAAGGALAGGVMGGVSSGLQYRAQYKAITKDLSKQADRLHKSYEQNIDEATRQIKEQFGDDVEITGRPKSEESTFDKLLSKFKKGKLNSLTDDACTDAIGDGLGTRIQMTSLTPEQSRSIINAGLKDSGYTYDDFIKYISGDLSGFDDTAQASLKQLSSSVIDSLKESQNKEVFEALIDGIKNNNKFYITELNNYGDDISSYFTKSQLEEIARVYEDVTKNKLTIVTKFDEAYAQAQPKYKVDKEGNFTCETKTAILKNKGSMKDSGYTSTQLNTVHKFNDTSQGLGELQLRGTEVNSFADIEHIPYDIRQGKITAADTKYADVYSTIKSLSPESYASYNSYLTKVYDWLRLKELGISLPEPALTGTFLTTKGKDISSDVIKLLSKDALLKYAH